MERDFMGIGGKDSDGLGKEESRGNQKDSSFVGGSAVRWTFSNRNSALQHLMSFKTAHEEKFRKAAFDHVASSRFQPVPTKDSFEPSYRASALKEIPQSCFTLDGQGPHQFSTHAYHPQSIDNFGASTHQMVSHPSMPVSMSSPFPEVHGSSNASDHQVASLKQQSFGGFTSHNPTLMGSGSGAFVARNVSSPTAPSQLTIFYAGLANVYNDVPLEKAQAIMLLASKSCNATSNAPNQNSDSPVSSPIPKVAIHTLAQRQTQIASHVSSPISVTPHLGVQSRNSSSTIDDVAGVKNVSVSPTSLRDNEPSKATNTSAAFMPRAIPQARKASIARFLEKRKERVTTAMPYSCAKTSPENSAGLEGANASSKCSSPNLSLSSNREESWCSVQPKNHDESSEFPRLFGLLRNTTDYIYVVVVYLLSVTLMLLANGLQASFKVLLNRDQLTFPLMQGKIYLSNVG